MPIDPDMLLAMPPIIIRQVLKRCDTMLYALGVGATELDFVFEDRLKALPTMAVVLGYPGFFWRDATLGVDWQKILHGEQSMILHNPLPVEGEVVGTTCIEALFDKGVGKGALAMVKREIYDGTDVHLATLRSMIFMRGDGGFGGTSDGAPVPHPVPERTPDMVTTFATAKNQALVYRLSGDLNPLHIDPDVAKRGGFETPILHGLATYGVIGRALLATCCANEPGRLKRMDGRFSAPVYPGETIETAIWDEGTGQIAFRARAVERDQIVFTNGYAEIA